MHAVILRQFGGPEHLALEEVAKPTASSGQVLVRIRASAVNPVDVKIREGLPIGPALPAVLGADFSGVVESVGPDVLQFNPGDAVYGCAGGVKGHGGSLAQFMAADARLLALKPRTLSFRDAAALPLVAITAWEAVERAQVKQHDVILVHGGVGGVGHVAVQLAKWKGAEVSASVGADEDFELVRSLGAKHALNYKTERVEDYVNRITGGRGFDAVIDTAGAGNLIKSFEAAAIGGQVATINARTSVDLSNMHAKALSLHLVFMLLPMLRGSGRERHGWILSQVANLVDAGHIRPLLDPTRFTLKTAADAHRLLGSGNAKGKIVVDIE